VKYPDEIYPEPKSKDYKRFLFTFWNEYGTINVQLPSGRILKYPHARIRKGDNSLVWEHGHLWGGSITENLDQAVARDILAEAILRIEDAGIPIVLHAHDEIVGLVPEENAEQSLQKAIELMRTVPSWAIGLPIAAEGKIVKRYEK
jgi:DNA polymerase